MAIRKKRILLITAALIVSVFCAFMIDMWAYKNEDHFDTRMEEAAVFTDGHEVFWIYGCLLVDNRVIIVAPDPQFAVPAKDDKVSLIHVVFSEPVAQNIDLQVFYALSEANFSEDNSQYIKIPEGSTEARILIPEAEYSSFRFDFEQEVGLDTIYEGYEIRSYHAYQTNVLRVILLAIEIFATLCGCVYYSVKAKEKKADADGKERKCRKINEKKECTIKRNPFFAIFFCNLFLVLTVMFFQPLEYLLANIEAFAFPVWKIWWIQLLLSIFITVALSVLMWLLPTKAGRTAATVSLSLGIAFLTQALLFNGGRPFAMNDSWPTEVENIIAWFGIVLFTVVTTLYYQGEYGRKYDIAFTLIACLLIAVQVFNYTIISTSVDFFVREPDYLEEKEYHRYVQADDPELIQLEGNMLNISMYRGMPFILKSGFSYDMETVYVTSFQGMEGQKAEGAADN